MTLTLPSELPPLSCGDTFRVRSLSGTPRTLTFVARGDDAAGLYVRLPDRRLARLDPERVDWEALEQAVDASLPILCADDEVLLDTTAGQLRGWVVSQCLRSLVLSVPPLGERCCLWSHVLELHLVHHAPALRAGDRFLVQSRSGNTYRGQIRAADGATGTLTARLHDGRVVEFRLERLDLSTLRVLVPVSLERLRGQLELRLRDTRRQQRSPPARGYL